MYLVAQTPGFKPLLVVPAQGILKVTPTSLLLFVRPVTVK